MFKERIGNLIYEISHKRVECPDGSEYNNHVHSYCELLLFIRGSADYSIDGRIYSPRPFDLLLIPEAKYHYLIPKDGVPYENYVIGFSPSLLEREHHDRLFAPPLVTNIMEDTEALGFFYRLDFYRERYEMRDFETCAEMLVRELLVYLSYCPKSSVEPEHRHIEPVASVLGIIEEHLCEPLCAEYIAGKLFLSKSYIQNSFSRDMHIGLKQYITQRKIFAAKSDMEKGMTALQVCQKYAFEDYSVFYRAFRRVLGRSPTEEKRGL